MNLEDRDRLTEFSRNFSESSMYASYVTAWNKVVSPSCYSRLTGHPVFYPVTTGALYDRYCATGAPCLLNKVEAGQWRDFWPFGTFSGVGFAAKKIPSRVILQADSKRLWTPLTR